MSIKLSGFRLEALPLNFSEQALKPQLEIGPH